VSNAVWYRKASAVAATLRTVAPVGVSSRSHKAKSAETKQAHDNVDDGDENVCGDFVMVLWEDSNS